MVVAMRPTIPYLAWTFVKCGLMFAFVVYVIERAVS